MKQMMIIMAVAAFCILLLLPSFGVVAYIILVSTVLLMLRKAQNNTFLEELRRNALVLILSTAFSIGSYIAIGSAYDLPVWVIILYVYAYYSINSLFSMIFGKLISKVKNKLFTL
ncbi:hypothetical protein [Pseudoalteromonas sp. OOF1S-7]|uniref:hypothetical protein n=1 Tax=Pseudoalteromonas sp. OOF1S-7 TaxID=2917757 RepID=UPI001EF414BD|nr:hypothetical protein [Pseudoalteromonas sp. OOF1S-7]MCG7537953.1 hypothetical protein [Pseudoalteromonas sp. OOF1S-7]